MKSKYIYIYIKREREGERETEEQKKSVIIKLANKSCKKNLSKKIVIKVRYGRGKKDEQHMHLLLTSIKYLNLISCVHDFANNILVHKIISL